MGAGLGLVVAAAGPADAASVKTVRVEGEHGFNDGDVPEACPLDAGWGDPDPYYFEAPFDVTNSYSNSGYVASGPDGEAGFVKCKFYVPYGKKVVSIDARFGEGPTNIEVVVDGGNATPSLVSFWTESGESTRKDAWTASSTEFALTAGEHTIEFRSLSRHVVLDFFQYQLFTDTAPAPTTTTTTPPPAGQEYEGESAACTGGIVIQPAGSYSNTNARMGDPFSNPPYGPITCTFTLTAEAIGVDAWMLGRTTLGSGSATTVHMTMDGGTPQNFAAQEGSVAWAAQWRGPLAIGTHSFTLTGSTAGVPNKAYGIDYFETVFGSAPGPSGNTECDDGFDNDYDGEVDYPDDVGCYSLSDDAEAYLGSECDDGIDNDSDGLVDYTARPGGPLYDPECVSQVDNSEGEADAQVTECSDGEDNDGDNAVDYPADTGCLSAQDPVEWKADEDGPPPGPDEDCELSWNPASWLSLIRCGIPALIKDLFGLFMKVVDAIWDAMRWLVDQFVSLFVPTNLNLDVHLEQVTNGFPVNVIGEVTGSVTTTIDWFTTGLSTTACGSFDYSEIAAGLGHPNLEALNIKLPNPSDSACPTNSAATDAGETAAGDLFGWRAELRMILTLLLFLGFAMKVIASFAPKEVAVEPAVPVA